MLHTREQLQSLAHEALAARENNEYAYWHALRELSERTGMPQADCEMHIMLLATGMPF